MTGIREMFAEYSGEDVDWFQLAFAFETEYQARLAYHRQWQRLHRAQVRADPVKREKRRTYMREYMRGYSKRRRAEDPAYREARRKSAREAMRRAYARKRAAA